MRNLIIGVIVVSVILAVGYLFLFSGSQNKACAIDHEAATQSADPVQGITITFSNGQFSPACLEISPGTSITWVNGGNKEIQIGSNPHPVHTGNKEVSGGEFVLNLAPGEKATVTMNKAGTSGYHDHLNSSAGGEIIVK